jgi:hypothetical protein
VRIEFYDIDGEVEVWLEHDVQFSGVCVGFGATREAAATRAVDYLRRKADEVSRLLIANHATSDGGNQHERGLRGDR